MQNSTPGGTREESSLNVEKGYTVAVQDAARDIVAAVGGPENIGTVTHCVTRLRFVLTDESRVDAAALDAVDEVKGSFSAGGQFQVVIGPGTVEKVYAALLEQTGGAAATKEEVKAAAAESMPAWQRFVKIFSDIFVPLLPALVTAGLLMGINNILTGDGIFFDDASLVDHATWLGDIAAIINMIANTAFVFLPVLIGWSAVKRFGGNPLLGIVLGAMLVHPDLLNAWAFGQAELEGGVPTWEVLGLHIQQVGYQGQVLPILVAAWVLVKIELWLKDRIADGFQLLVVAPVALLVTGFFSLLVIGPITFWIGDAVANALVWVFELAPAVGGLLYGFLYAPLVITGLHHTFLAVDLQLLSSTGTTFLWPILAISNTCQGAAAIGMYFFSRSAKQKGLALTSGVSAYLGITEPAIFGVNLRYKFPFFIGACIAGLAGAVIAFFGVKALSIGVGGVPGIFAIRPTDWGVFGLALLLCATVPALLTYLWARRVLPRDAAAERAEEETDLAQAQS